MVTGEEWALGEAYEPYVGRWSRPVAAELLEWLALPPGLTWLDVGCGTGVLTESIVRRCDPERVIAVDASEGFLKYAERQLADSRVRFQLGDAQALPLADASVDVAVSGLMLNFVPDPARALEEMRRVVRPDGTIALYVWDYADGMQLMRYFWDAAVAVDPDALPLDEGRRFPICQPERLESLLVSTGLDGVESKAIDVVTAFSDFDDYWRPFLGGQGPAPGYCAALPADRRERLRAHLAERLPKQSDGSIVLFARAFAVRGRRSRAG